MKVGISRFVMVAAMAALVVLAGSASLFAQSPNFPNFSSVAGLSLKGSAAQSGNVLRLTDGGVQESSAAWFTAEQPVAGAFSTSFSFQITKPDSNLSFPADGLAFVIQYSSPGADALGPNGCGIGFGTNSTGCTASGGITNSLAVEFDTFKNDGEPNGDPNGNHVSIQNCTGSGENRSSADCRVVDNASPTNGSQQPVNLSDGLPHTVTITYTPSTLSTCGDGGTQTCSVLHVSLDDNDLFGAVLFDLKTLGLHNNATAFVGFTGSTGDFVENSDILSWTFTPQSQSGAATAGGDPVVLNFAGGPAGNTNGYEYDTKLDAAGGGVNTNPAAATVVVNPIVVDQKTCNKLVQKSFPLTQCFVYQNADGLGHPGSVLFELTCPNFDGGTDSACGNTHDNSFAATLGSSFSFVKANNLGFNLLNSTIGPYPGWLKGDGGVAGSPCKVNPSNPNAPLFQSNQISSFSVVGDPLGTTKGKSGGGGSCWVATYATTGELPPGIKVTSPTFTTYNRNQVVQASYTCSDPKTSKPATSPVGPYLTVASCTQTQSPNGSGKTQDSGCVLGNVCTGGVDTSVKGLHLFQVTSKDSGGNVNVNAVIYNVK